VTVLLAYAFSQVEGMRLFSRMYRDCYLLGTYGSRGIRQRDSYCPYLLSSELTAKGTGLGMTAGKEDPFEFDSSLNCVITLGA